MDEWNIQFSLDQITIPSNLREEFKIRAGDTVYLLKEEDKLVIRKGPIRL